MEIEENIYETLFRSGGTQGQLVVLFEMLPWKNSSNRSEISKM